MLAAHVKEKLKDQEVSDEQIDQLGKLPKSVLNAMDWDKVVAVLREIPDFIEKLVQIFSSNRTADMKSAVEEEQVPNTGSVTFTAPQDAGGAGGQGAAGGRLERMGMESNPRRPVFGQNPNPSGPQKPQ